MLTATSADLTEDALLEAFDKIRHDFPANIVARPRFITFPASVLRTFHENARRMRRRKRDSKRRWKARFKIGRPVPEIVVLEHRLTPPAHWVKSPLREYWMPEWRMALECGMAAAEKLECLE